MTTVAMVAGMIPTAMSLSGDGAGARRWAPSVIGGLILSTLLTLLIVPAGFSLADGLEKRLGPWLAQARAHLRAAAMRGAGRWRPNRRSEPTAALALMSAWTR